MRGSILILFGILLINLAFSQPMFFVEEVNPKEVKPGEIYNLTLTLINLGNEFATYIRVTLDPKDISPIDPIGRFTYFIKKATEAEYSEKYFGIVKQYEKLTVRIPIFVKLNTRDNVYITPIILRYKDPDMKEHMQTLYIGILVRGYISIGISDIKVDPKEIRPGYNNIRIRIFLKNSGTSEAKDVITILNISYPFKYSYSSLPKIFLGNLRPNEIKYVDFFVDVSRNAKSGEYTIPLIIRYKDNYDRSYEEVKNILLVVKPRPYVHVYKYNTVPKILYNGERGKIYIRIKNIGEETARNIEIRIVPDVSHPFEFEDKTFFVSSLKGGEEATSVFNFKVKGWASENEYIIKVVIRYSGDWEEGDYNIYTKEDYIKIKVKYREMPIRNYVVSSILVIVIILGIIIGLKRLRR